MDLMLFHASMTADLIRVVLYLHSYRPDDSLGAACLRRAEAADDLIHRGISYFAIESVSSRPPFTHLLLAVLDDISRVVPCQSLGRTEGLPTAMH